MALRLSHPQGHSRRSYRKRIAASNSFHLKNAGHPKGTRPAFFPISKNRSWLLSTTNTPKKNFNSGFSYPRNFGTTAVKPSMEPPSMRQARAPHRGVPTKAALPLGFSYSASASCWGLAGSFSSAPFRNISMLLKRTFRWLWESVSIFFIRRKKPLSTFSSSAFFCKPRISSEEVLRTRAI